MLGSERNVTNSSQTVTGTLNLDSFGNQVGSTGSSGDPYMFAATSRYRNDGDAGLTLAGARYYDGQVGRFVSRDTQLDQVPYLHCDHDPVNKVDPTRHEGGPLDLAGMVLGKIGEGIAEGGKGALKIVAKSLGVILVAPVVVAFGGQVVDAAIVGEGSSDMERNYRRWIHHGGNDSNGHVGQLVQGSQNDFTHATSGVVAGTFQLIYDTFN